MKMKNISVALVFVLILITISCENNTLCLSGQNAIQSGFYSGFGGVESDTTLSGVYLWGIDPIEGDTMSVMVENETISKMFMSTDVNRDSTWFLLREKRIASDIQDTILFIYERQLNYVSGDCGFTYNLELDTVIYTQALIDSIVIEYSSVLYNENLENVKIFIEP
jgi:hypothetical protein